MRFISEYKKIIYGNHYTRESNCRVTLEKPKKYNPRQYVLIKTPEQGQFFGKNDLREFIDNLEALYESLED